MRQGQSSILLLSYLPSPQEILHVLRRCVDELTTVLLGEWETHQKHRKWSLAGWSGNPQHTAQQSNMQQ
jgi:hypothetical protein